MDPVAGNGSYPDAWTHPSLTPFRGRCPLFSGFGFTFLKGEVFLQLVGVILPRMEKGFRRLSEGLYALRLESVSNCPLILLSSRVLHEILARGVVV